MWKIFIGLMTIFSMVSALAVPPNYQPSDPHWPEYDHVRFKEAWNAGRQHLSNVLFFMPTAVDYALGNQKRGPQYRNQSQLRFYYFFQKAEGQDLNIFPNFILRLRFPRIQERFSFTFERNVDDPIVPGDPEGNFVNQETEAKKGQLASIGVETGREGKWNFRLKTGLRINLNPQAFVDSGVERRYEMGANWTFNPRQSLFYFTRDGFGGTTTLNFDKQIRSFLLFRLENQASWLDTTDEIFFIQGPSLFHTLSYRRSIGYHFKFRSSNKPKKALDSYDLSVVYRQYLHRRWWLYEITPTLTFDRGNDWKPSPGISFRIEVVLGREDG